LVKIGFEVWKLYRNQPAISIAITTVVVGATVVLAVYPPRLPTTHETATGVVRIDANPWGRIEWIQGPAGGRIDLPQGRTTPLSIALPVGTYTARVVYPATQTSQQCDLRVRPDQVATCWLNLAPVDAKAYLRRIGW
jgi:hypothetical protein